MTNPLSCTAVDLAETERIVQAAGTSFFKGMRVLQADRRAAMYAIYAFCRLVDDIADDVGPMDEKRAKLDAWRGTIAALYRGEAEDPVTRVLLAAIRRFSLREADFLAVIDGMQSDAETVIVAPDSWALDQYCDQVASAVGRLSVRAFGDSSAAADEVAFHLGRALQLTNILRDLAEDAARGRLYLPREYLFWAGVPRNPRDALTHPALPRVCLRVVRDAEAHFSAATDAMRRCDPAAMRPARIMAATYHAILRALRRRGWKNLADKPRIAPVDKFFIAARYMLARAFPAEPRGEPKA
jgi:phytoene synthase